MLTVDAPFAAHPGLSAEAWPPTAPDCGSAEWTLDMDDTLCNAVRLSSFDFEVASRNLQNYVVKLRACGGVLPDEVQAPLYTADVCRTRWAHLDFLACKAFRARASGEKLLPQMPEEPPAAVPPARARPATTVANDDDDDDDDGDGDDYGIIDINALRAQKLSGLFGPVPALPAASTKPRKARAPAAAPAPRAPAAAPAPRAPAAAPTPPASGSSSSMFGGLAAGLSTGSATGGGPGGSSRSHQLAELERLAADLAGAAGSGAGSGRGSVPGSVPRASPGMPGVAPAAAALLGPLGQLRERMAGLEALLADEATDMAAKLGEVAQVTREMAELQNLAKYASHAHAAAIDGDDDLRDDDLSTLDGDEHRPMSSYSGAAMRAPLRFTPAPANGLNLEALDGLDLDGLLARLEAEKHREAY